MSSVEMYSQVIPASGRIDLGPGNYLLGFSTTAGTLNLRIQTPRNTEGISGAAGNALIRRIEPWQYAFIQGTVGATVVFAYGTLDNTEEDVTDIRASVSAITGNVNVVEVSDPTTLSTSPAQATRATGGADTIAANAARKALIVSHLDTSLAAVIFLQSVGAGANRGIPVYPGQTVSLLAPASAYDVRNDSSALATYNVQEYT